MFGALLQSRGSHSLTEKIGRGYRTIVCSVVYLLSVVVVYTAFYIGISVFSKFIHTRYITFYRSYLCLYTCTAVLTLLLLTQLLQVTTLLLHYAENISILTRFTNNPSVSFYSPILYAAY